MNQNNMERKYNFIYLEKKTYTCFQDKTVDDYLKKWSMKANLRTQAYAFNEPFHSYNSQEFVNAFFKDPGVLRTLQTSMGLLANPPTNVDVQQLPCSVTSMSFFDRLLNSEHNIIRGKNKAILKCLDTPVDDFIVSDELRRMLIDPESDNYALYSEADRKQFIFRLMTHLCLGGEWCQYEDEITPYLETVRTIYKDLVSVQRDPETEMIFVNSVVLQIVARDEDGKAYFPVNPDNIQNFVYLIINPFSRDMTVLSNSFKGEFCF